MSDSLPKGWVRAPLKDAVALLQNGPFGSLLHRSDYVEGGTPLINPANIVAGKLVPDLRITVGSDVLKRLASYVMKPGDVVVGRRGEMGRSALVTSERQQWFCGTGCAFIRPGEAFDSKYLTMWFGSPQVRATLEAVSVGATMSNLSTRILGQLDVLVPPLAEQRRIVAAVEALLARVSMARERLERVPLLLKGFRQSVLAKAFSGELVPTDADLAAREGRRFHSPQLFAGRSDSKVDNDLPSGWVDVRLGDLIDGFEAGRNLAAHGRPAGAKEFGVLRISAVTWGEFRPEENKALRDGDNPKPHELVKQGDLLITRANTSDLVGAVVLVGEDHPTLMLPDKILRLIVRGAVVEPRFLVHALRSAAARNYFARNATGTSESMRNLSQPKLAATPVRLPPLPEQRRIVEKLEALLAFANSLEHAVKRVRSALGRAPLAILQRAFAGELVPQDPNDEPASSALARLNPDLAARAKAPDRAERTRLLRSHAKESSMINRKEVSQNHLSAILKKRGALAPEALWKASELDIDDFYDQLKDEHAQGLLRERANTRPNGPRFLEAAA